MASSIPFRSATTTQGRRMTGGYGVEFNTIAVDDGIAMGHDDMLDLKQFVEVNS